MRDTESVCKTRERHSHAHACLIFDELACYRKVAFDYILEGIRSNEKCIMAIDSYSPGMIAEDFKRHGLCVDDYLKNGFLTIVDVQTSYAGDQGFEPEKTIEIWQRETRKAIAQGFGALRVVGEATFSIGKAELARKLIHYENLMNAVLFPYFGIKSLCVYDKSLYPPQIIKAAIKAHPTLFYNEEVFEENIHYIPPEVHFKSENEGEEIDFWLENVKRNNANIRSLRKSEEEFRTLVENAGDAIYIAKAGVIQFANRKTEMLSGYTTEELTSRPFIEFIHPEDRELMLANHLRRLEDQTVPSSYAFRISHKSGEVRHVELNSVVTVWKGDRATLNFLRDISERKAAEERIIWNARRYELLSKTAAALLQSDDPQHLVEELCGEIMTFLGCHAFFNFLADKQSGRLRLNAYAGIPEDEARKIEWLDYGVTVCGCVALERSRRIAEDIDASDDINTALVKSYGIQAYCCHPLMIQNRLIGTLSFGTRSRSRFRPEEIEVMETVTHLVAIAMHRIATEKELLERNQFIEAILDNLPIGLAVNVIDQGRATYINRKFEEIYGWPKEELEDIEQFFANVYPDPVYRQKIKTTILSDIQSHDPERMVWDGFDITTKKGEKRIIGAKNIPLYEQNLMISTVQDITDNRRMQERLQQAQKMEAIGSLAGGIAHDFNNILFPILGLSEMLLEDLPDGSLEKENARQILIAGKRASELVKQILAFSRQTEQTMMPVSIQKVLREVIRLSRATIPSSIEIAQDIQTDCGLVLGNTTQIHQVAMNLITNAFHAIDSAPGKITIALRETQVGDDNPHVWFLDPGRYARLSISDTGVGIDSSIMDRIFDPYFTTKPQGKGTGLGLAVVFGIIKKYKGDIKVESVPGEGTTFHVYIPLLKSDREAGDGKVAAIITTGHERILLVDDEEAIVKTEKKMLERLGYTITSHTSSLEALDRFRQKPDDFDLVISDMTMPNMTGDRLAKQLMAIRPDIPIIICTGFSETLDTVKAEAMGISGVLMKPVTKADMADMVRTVLDRKK